MYGHRYARHNLTTYLFPTVSTLDAWNVAPWSLGMMPCRSRRNIVIIPVPTTIGGGGGGVADHSIFFSASSRLTDDDETLG